MRENYNMKKAFDLVIGLLNDTTYDYKVISIKDRNDHNDFEFEIIEYGPSYQTEKYFLYVNKVNNNNEVLNAFNEPVNVDTEF
jgi:hypothetical protein